MTLRTKKMTVDKPLLVLMNNHEFSRSRQARMVARKLSGNKYDLEKIPKYKLQKPTQLIDIELPEDLYETKTNLIRDCLVWEFEKMQPEPKGEPDQGEIEHIANAAEYVEDLRKKLKPYMKEKEL